METFKVVFEIELNAQNPTEAARFVQDWLQNSSENWQFNVQNKKSKKIHSIDLEQNTIVEITDTYKPMIK